jgi:hypothetical protein
MAHSRKVDRTAAAWLVIVLALAGLTMVGCGDSDSSPPTATQDGLPDNPEDWVCADTQPPTTQAEIDAWCDAHPDRGLPLPEALRDPPPVEDFERYQAYNVLLKRFVTQQEYLQLHWISDPNWRFSGPSLLPPGGNYSHNFGPHFPLKVFYSPEVVEWLCKGREGDIPDGAMILKVMTIGFSGLTIARAADGCMDVVGDKTIPALDGFWAPMVKSSKASHDGWIWTLEGPPLGFPLPQFPPTLLDQSGFISGAETLKPPVLADNPAWYPTGSVIQLPLKPINVATLFPIAGSPYCLSCHATAESESTFASMDNILGKELRYKVFDSAPPATPTPGPSKGFNPFPRPLDRPQAAFLEFFDQVAPVPFSAVWETRMPASTYDQQVISAHDGPGQFLTSAQCGVCHNATPQSSLMPKMTFVTEEPGRSSRVRNLSVSGEWSVSPMGLSGRDPVFFSQLQSETNHLPALKTCVETLCLHCHGAMGERQLAIDTPSQADEACKELFAIAPPPEVPFGKPLRREVLQQWPGGAERDEQFYGALARDGVSCTVCHHIADTGLGQEETFTGNFVTGPADQINGPYQDDTIVTMPMEQALGVKPQFAEQISSSDLCGSCHNILLPIFDNAGQRHGAGYEQATHLEWTNSDSGRPGPQFRSCQDCHMPTDYKGEKLQFKIANSESNDQFPPTTHRLPDKDIKLTERSKYSRHSLHGLNLFLNQFFQQFPLLLGFQQIDVMSEQPAFLDPPAPGPLESYNMELPLFTGFETMLELAQQDTARLAVGPLRKTTGGELRTNVTVTNLAGHYLPTGVGFRRMFIELQVLDRQGALLWASGRTNDLGFILDGTSDRVLESEQPVRYPAAPPQPHYQVIGAGNQVQIYQELITDSAGALTTSFLRRYQVIKDNRIRPKGFDPQVFSESPSPYIQALAELPGGEASDPYYVDPRLTGADQIEYRIPLDAETLARADRVQATLYYQSIPPSYLQQRFADAGVGSGPQDDIERLYYITSHLNIAGATSDEGEAVLQSWKLRLASAARSAQ